jgi:hypothetical protein
VSWAPYVSDGRSSCPLDYPILAVWNTAEVGKIKQVVCARPLGKLGISDVPTIAEMIGFPGTSKERHEFVKKSETLAIRPMSVRPLNKKKF